MLYYIILFIVLIAIAYIVGLSIVTLVDKHLSRISINLPKQNVVVNMRGSTSPFESSSEQNDLKNGGQGGKDFPLEFDNYILSYKNVENEVKEVKENFELNDGDICLENHMHVSCNKGKMNYPDPHSMTPIDRKYFKYNYQKDYKLQDYVNWLWTYLNTEDELPYEHLKNYMKLTNGTKIDEVPKTKLENFVSGNGSNMEKYFQKMYEDIGNKPLQTKEDYRGYNINEYPTCIKK